MNYACPHCGAPVAFRYDDSLVRVCDSCHTSVARTDRGIESLGKFADIMPLASRLWLFAEGALGNLGFFIAGRIQIQHAAGGVWQEWFAKFSDGRWGWIADAQGKYMLSFEAPVGGSGNEAPRWESLTAGAVVPLAGQRDFVVAERGEATYVAAEGELPVRIVPGERYRYADLSTAGSKFATIDYGVSGAAGTWPPKVYVGNELVYSALTVIGTPPVQATPRAVQAKKIACPQCNGSIDLRAPGETLRIGCPYCGVLMSTEHDAVKLVSKARTVFGARTIQLGTEGTFEGVRYVCIGAVRKVVIGAQEYPYTEYLYFHPEHGFRWLVESDGHFSWVEPLPAGLVPHGSGVTWCGRTFVHGQTCLARVTAVVGELYWRAEVGDTTSNSDYLSPPFMVSREQNEQEVAWSLGRYLEPSELEKAMGAKLKLPPHLGVGANQPYPHLRTVRYLWLAFVALIATLLLLAIAMPSRVVLRHTLRSEDFGAPPVPAGTPAASATASATPGDLPTNGAAPATATPTPTARVAFTPTFRLQPRQNIEIRLSASPADNSWLALGGDLLNEDTGEFDAFDRELSVYRGVEGGEAWSEVSSHTTVLIPARPAGTYALRIEAESSLGAIPPVTVVVRQRVLVTRYVVFAFVAVGGLLLGFLLHRARFERQRKEALDIGAPGDDIGGNGDSEDDDE